MVKETKRYCFTFNNYTEEGIETFKTIVQGMCIYLYWSHEVAPTTGTPHLQGYLELKKKTRASVLGKIFKTQEKKPNFCAANGSAKENEDYIEKPDYNII